MRPDLFARLARAGLPADGETEAVALAYEPETVRDAPRVIARGRGELARRILEVAEREGIPIRRDSDLLGILAQVEVDEEIPLEAFLVVAELLKVIYRLNGRAVPQPGGESGQPDDNRDQEAE